MDFIHICPNGRYKSKVLNSTIPTQGCDLEVKITNFEFSYSQTFYFQADYLIYHQDQYPSKGLHNIISYTTLTLRDGKKNAHNIQLNLS